jgi:hypothetical protein
MIEKTDMIIIDMGACFLAYLCRMCVVLLNEISNLLLIYWFSAVVLSYTLAAISPFESANGGYYSASLKLQILLLKNLALYGRD